MWTLNQEVAFPIKKKQTHKKTFLYRKTFSPLTPDSNVVAHSCGSKNCESGKRGQCPQHLLWHDLFTCLESAWNLTGKEKLKVYWGCSYKVLTSEDEAQPPSTDPLSNPSKERGAASAFPRFRQTSPSNASGSFLLVSSCPHLQSEFQNQLPKLSSWIWALPGPKEFTCCQTSCQWLDWQIHGSLFSLHPIWLLSAIRTCWSHTVLLLKCLLLPWFPCDGLPDSSISSLAPLPLPHFVLQPSVLCLLSLIIIFISKTPILLPASAMGFPLSWRAVHWGRDGSSPGHPHPQCGCVCAQHGSPTHTQLGNRVPLSVR